MGVPDAPSHRKEVGDYLRWQDDVAQMPHHQTAVLTLGEAPCRASICVHKTRELGPVTADEHRTLRRLVSELEPAFQLAFRHNEMLTSAFWDGIIVGRFDQMAFLLDERGRVMRQTDAAGALATTRDGVGIVARRLTARLPAEIAALHAVIAQAIKPVSPRSGAMRISRASGRLPLILVCYPLQRSARMIAPLEAAALVRIIDPTTRRARADESLIADAFGLTPREAELARLFVAGHSVESAAATLGIAVPTARTHLHRLFEKTGSTRQSELVALLAELR